MSPNALARLVDPRSLTARDTRSTFDALLARDSTDTDRAALLLALALRSLSPDELARFAREMQRRAVPFAVPRRDRPVDLCGSGGARTPSFNVSTVSAFVVAASGVPVVKHGNRSSRGLCGSSDLLEALGLPVTSSLSFAHETYRAVRLAFLHAPLYHPATRAVAAARKALGIPTVFNHLGPLSNPARIPYQLVGVADSRTAERAVQVLARLGRVRAMAVTSAEGCDEFSPRRETTAYLWRDGRYSRKRILPDEFLPSDDRRGSWGALPPSQAAEEARRVLAGGGGARRGAVLLTAGAALWISSSARTLRQGVDKAREALDSGRAEAILETVVSIGARHASDGPR